MKQEEIIKKIDDAISELVYEKTALMKAYNYYNCKRDPDQFRHLEMNYGLGTPSQIEFTPLIRKHIDALVGEYTSVPTKPRISCKDEDTLSNIMRDKDVKIKQEVFSFYKQKLQNQIITLFGQPNQGQGQSNDPLIQNELKKLIDDLQINFISEYEIAAQNIVNYTMQARDIDFETKKALVARDLYISGTSYYKVNKTKSGDHYELEILNPLHTFIDRNPNSIYLKNSYRSVIRRYMNKIEVLSKYGSIMSKEAIEEVKRCEQGYSTTGNTYYVRAQELDGNPRTNGILAGLEVQPGLINGQADLRINSRLLEVLEVEWLEVEKENDEWVTYKYEGIRINGNIYIPIGKVEECVRSISSPTETCLSVNGIFFSDRNGLPFSLVLATANLQDKYDILHFYRDNLISSSGTKGDWLDVSTLPSFLGEDLTERIQKYIAYKKQLGVAIIDTSQEGRAFNNNTTFSGYDDTLQAGLMQAFDYAFQSIENTCSSITGVSRERLANGIEQKDAVTNVEVGVKMSAIVTRQYSQTLDTLIKEMLTDCLNMAKIVYKNGIKGVLTLGDKYQKIFTALPQYFTLTDFDIHINDSSELLKDVETIKQFTQSLIQAGIVDAETAVDAIDAKSLTELKSSVKNSIKKQKEEQGMVAQLQQQLQQAQQQLQQMQQQLQQSQQAQQQIDQQKMQFDAQQAEADREIEWFKAKSDKKYKDETIESKDKLLDAEVAQLRDGNTQNNEIKNVV